LRSPDPAEGHDAGRATSSADLSQSPTLAHTGTAAGLILGTAAYMSPEQARGKAVDKRADIWSFGVVLYEMLTGRRLFEGETVSDVLAGVLRTDPDWSALPPQTPESARGLLRRCLERDPLERLRDIGEARLADVNEVLADLTQANTFVTAAVLSIARRSARVRAGGPSPDPASRRRLRRCRVFRVAPSRSAFGAASPTHPPSRASLRETCSRS
jgi:serine/threonine protein kinase